MDICVQLNNLKSYFPSIKFPQNSWAILSIADQIFSILADPQVENPPSKWFFDD
jgi:hypothetical protein